MVEEGGTGETWLHVMCTACSGARLGAGQCGDGDHVPAVDEVGARRVVAHVVGPHHAVCMPAGPFSPAPYPLHVGHAQDKVVRSSSRAARHATRRGRAVACSRRQLSCACLICGGRPQGCSNNTLMHGQEPCTLQDGHRARRGAWEGRSPESSHVRDWAPVKLSRESFTMTRTRPCAGCWASGR